MASAYPELHEQAETIDMWLAREEEAFGQTLEQGSRILAEHIERAKARGEEGIGAEAAFQLHDTYGFPLELTLELAGEQGLGVDEQGFEEMMERQRAARALRGRPRRRATRCASASQAFAEQAGRQTTFTGYETLEQATEVARVDAGERQAPRQARRSRRSTPTGGGQVADHGVVECEHGDCAARVLDVVRLGDDQALVLEPVTGELHAGRARDRARRPHGAPRRPSATTRRPTCCTRRCASASARHVRQAGSYVGPDKLRFDFTHGAPLERRGACAPSRTASTSGSSPTSPCARSRRRSTRRAGSARWRCSARSTATSCGWSRSATAQWSRELCGGTHVRSTAEIGVFKITTETSSAANVRRIEAVTGPGAVELLRRHDRELAEAAATLRTTPDNVAEAVAEREQRRRELEKQLRSGAAAGDGAGAEQELVQRAQEIDGVRVLAEQSPVADPKAMMDLADRLKNALGDARDRARRQRARGACTWSSRSRPRVGRARREGRRGGQGGRAGRRRRRRRARHDGPGRRPRPREAARRAGRRRARRSSGRSRG